MKIQKGEAGYIRKQKKKLSLILILYVIFVAALLGVGYLLNGSKLNMLTLLAILVCLPACRVLVNLIMFIGHRSINESKEMEISGSTEHLTVIYDTIITSERRAMQIHAIAISNHTVCGYTSDKKVDTAYAARHIKSILHQNKVDNITVKIFNDYVAFLSRAEGMENIAAIEKADTLKTENEIKNLILNISL